MNIHEGETVVWIVIGSLLKVKLVRIKQHIVSERFFFSPLKNDSVFKWNHLHCVCKQMNTVHGQHRFRCSWNNDNNNNNNCNCVCAHTLACMFVCVCIHTHTCHGGQWTSLWSCFLLSTVYGSWGFWGSGSQDDSIIIARKQ